MSKIEKEKKEKIKKELCLSDNELSFIVSQLKSFGSEIFIVPEFGNFKGVKFRIFLNENFRIDYEKR